MECSAALKIHTLMYRREAARAVLSGKSKLCINTYLLTAYVLKRKLAIDVCVYVWSQRQAKQEKDRNRKR